MTILPIFRTSLPAEQFQRNDFSLWSVLKQCIGKELSKITMPVVFNEPLSFLQRMAEYMEYAWLLEKADQAQDPVTRMQVSQRQKGGSHLADKEARQTSEWKGRSSGAAARQRSVLNHFVFLLDGGGLTVIYSLTYFSIHSFDYQFNLIFLWGRTYFH